jgi:hypothetical protein
MTNLISIAKDINDLHDKAQQAAESAVDYAMLCGKKLIEAKAAAGHGKFLIWLQENFRGSADLANKYMRLARNSERVMNLPPEEKPESIRQALQQLSAPDQEPAQESEIEQARKFTKKCKALQDELTALKNVNIEKIEDFALLRMIDVHVKELSMKVVENRIHAMRQVGRLIKELKERGLTLKQINELAKDAT